MSFAVERTATGEGVCVAVAGEVDIDTAPRMRTALMAAVSSGRPVVVDLGAVTFMDSGGLAVLVAVHRAAEARGQALRLQDVPRVVRRLFRITGLDTLFEIVPAAEDDPAG